MAKRGKKERPLINSKKNGKIEISPIFMKGHDVKNKAQAVDEAVRRGKNISYALGYVYQAQFGGRSITPPKESKDRKTNGNQFLPDHVQRVKGNTIRTEIKSVSSSGSRPFCGASQFFKYSRALLKSLNRGETNPEVYYAIFRYGASKPNYGYGLTSFNHHQAMRIVSKDIRD